MSLDNLAFLSATTYLVCVPVDSSVGIRIGINNSHTLEVGSRLEGWTSNSISYELSVVILNDGS